MSVTQFNNALKDYFNKIPTFKNVYVKGEVTGKFESSIHHVYFDLKDDESIVPCIIYRWNRNNIGFEVEDGMELLVTANIIIYPSKGKLELNVLSATDDGLGRLFLAYKQLKKRLENEGLFDDEHKRELPEFPKKIGVVTSRGGSVIHDIIKTVEENWPYCQVILFPAAVQGANSKMELVTQIRRADDFGVDVLIIARGGGSLKELWSFNEEEVVRSVFNCSTPVISAIGHEDNATLCDLVADKRASTPTMAASLAIRNKDDVQIHINHLHSRLLSFISSKFDRSRKEFDNVISKPLFKDSTFVYQQEKSDFDGLCNRFFATSNKMINSNSFMLNKIKQEYVIRHPCKIQVDNKKYDLNEAKNHLIDSMNSIINDNRVNLDKAANNFKFQSKNLLVDKRHSLEISKSYLKTNPCQNQIDLLRGDLDRNRNKLNREVELKLESDRRDLDVILDKSIFKSPEKIYSGKSRELIGLRDKFAARSKQLLLTKSHDFENVKNTLIIKNPSRIYSKREDALNKNIERLVNKSNELILANSYRLNSIKRSQAIRNHLDNHLTSNHERLDAMKSDLERSFSSKISENRREFNFMLSKRVFENPEMLYESKCDELDRIKASKVMKNPHILLEDYKKQLKVYEDRLDNINQMIMLKKEQQKQKTIYIGIIVAFVIALILIIIFGGIL